MSLIKNKINYILGKNFDFKIGFIICGTQKGGTTALDRYLRLHPEICMANKKEVHFFDSDKYFQKQNPDFSKYHFHFNPKDHHKIIGEATPIYMYWENAIKRIHNYNPNMKLIAVLRDPSARAFSHWNMERDKNREHRTFWDAIKSEENKLLEPGKKQDRTFSYLERGLYSKQIKIIKSYFKRDQILFLQNDSLRKNPNQVLSKVSEFLTLSSFQTVEHMEIHTRSYPFELSKKENDFLKTFYNDEIDELETILDWDLNDWKALNE